MEIAEEGSGPGAGDAAGSFQLLYPACEVMLIRWSGDLDHHLATRADAALAGRVPEARILLLDLEAVPYIDSGGVALILGLLRDLVHRGWVGVIAPQPQVLRLFEVVGLPRHQAFRLFANRDDAVGEAVEARETLAAEQPPGEQPSES